MIIEQDIRAIMPMILDKNFSRAEKEKFIKEVVLAACLNAFLAGKLYELHGEPTLAKWIESVTEDAITDEILVEEWSKLGNIPINEEEQIDEDYTVGQGHKWQTSWPKGTDREDIWRWFDMRHSIGVYKLATND